METNINEFKNSNISNKKVKLSLYKFLKSNSDNFSCEDYINIDKINQETLKKHIRESFFIQTIHKKLREELLEKESNFFMFLSDLILNNYIPLNIGNKKVLIKSRDFAYILIDILDESISEDNSLGTSDKFYILSNGKTKQKLTLILNNARKYIRLV